MSQQTGELVLVCAAVLTLLGGIMRYVVRLAVTVAATAETGRDTATALERVTDKLEDHAVRLAVVEARARP